MEKSTKEDISIDYCKILKDYYKMLEICLDNGLYGRRFYLKTVPDDIYLECLSLLNYDLPWCNIFGYIINYKLDKQDLKLINRIFGLLEEIIKKSRYNSIVMEYNLQNGVEALSKRVEALPEREEALFSAIKEKLKEIKEKAAYDWLKSEIKVLDLLGPLEKSECGPIVVEYVLQNAVEALSKGEINCSSVLKEKLKEAQEEAAKQNQDADKTKTNPEKKSHEPEIGD